MIYDQQSPEYRENGLYEIGGELWFSIWTFKNKLGGSRNMNFINLTDAVELSKRYEFITLVPEIGPFDTVRGFREKDLRAFYNIQE